MRITSLAALKVVLGLAAAVAAAPAQAQALACGTTLYQSVTLTADVICNTAMDGLTIGADKVTIELNGYSIKGPYTFASPTSPATGVVSSGFYAVRIVGPGSISGFYSLVDIEGGNNHLISGVEAISESGVPVSLRNSSGSVVERSRISFLVIASSGGYRATANRIVGNDIGPAPGLPGGGIGLRGCDTADNVVANNSINPNYAHAVSIVEGAHSNQVLKNKMALGQVYLAGTSNNLVADNAIRNDAVTFAGVEINSYPVACARGAILPGSKNIVRGNRMRSGQLGVWVDDYSGTVLSTDNLITGNAFSDQTNSALYFTSNSANNDARGNTYVNVPVVAQDYGTGNLWP